MMSQNVAIRLDNVSKRYPNALKDSLTNINLSIREGSIFGLLGPNGAGKTTLISIMCGIFSPTSGTVSYFLDNQPVHENERRSRIGFVPQDFAFYHELTLAQNLEYFGAMYRMSKSDINKRISELLPVLGLEHVQNERVRTFSGGMKRRVNLALGILHSPSFLFLDEPTVGVDVQSKNSIIRFLQDLNRSGTTIIYTSHHLSEAQEFCDYLALVDQGVVIAEGEMYQILSVHGKSDLQSLFIALTGEEYRD
jgi:ABC-2 type transport system ATP-binding protein